MKTSVSGVTSYVQNKKVKYKAELVVNSIHYQKRGFTNFEDAKKYKEYLDEKYLPDKIIKVDSEKIVETYRKTESIRETAITHNMSRVKVRKILITEGLYSTPKSIEVNKLLNDGLTAYEVSEKLNISIGSVNNLSVYRKGEHNSDSPSRLAINARKWRNKK